MKPVLDSSAGSFQPFSVCGGWRGLHHHSLYLRMAYMCVRKLFVFIWFITGTLTLGAALSISGRRGEVLERGTASELLSVMCFRSL